jgi:hypothetical protein
MSAAAWFCLGYLAGMVTLVGAMCVGERFARNAEYYPEVPMTMEELQSRRERLTQSLMESV